MSFARGVDDEEGIHVPDRSTSAAGYVGGVGDGSGSSSGTCAFTFAGAGVEVIGGDEGSDEGGGSTAPIAANKS